MTDAANSDLLDAVRTVPPGKWAVGVSGGADSVALLLLLQAHRPDLPLHVVHLDHETRNGESATDAAFVSDLCRRLALPCTLTRRGEIESVVADLPKNRSARFRAARMWLFRDVVKSGQLDGVILAHHAGDQAETILQRLLRGSGPAALAGMSASASVCDVRILRPLLSLRGEDLRQYLRGRNQPWREDSSNASPDYQRNRIRPILAEDEQLRDSVLALGEACARWKKWLGEVTPGLEERFEVSALASLPLPLARQAAGQWLKARGCPVDEITQAACDRLVHMAVDAASAARQHFPGAVLVRRRRGLIFIESD